jgi:hypothetical protein
MRTITVEIPATWYVALDCDDVLRVWEDDSHGVPQLVDPGVFVGWAIDSLPRKEGGDER